jgi:hypothetical protein
MYKVSSYVIVERAKPRNPGFYGIINQEASQKIYFTCLVHKCFTHICMILSLHLYVYICCEQQRSSLHLPCSIFRVFNEFVAEGYGIIAAIWTGASIFNISASTLLQY